MLTRLSKKKLEEAESLNAIAACIAAQTTGEEPPKAPPPPVKKTLLPSLWANLGPAKAATPERHRFRKKGARKSQKRLLLSGGQKNCLRLVRLCWGVFGLRLVESNSHVIFNHLIHRRVH